jgi:hypothetical protein
MRWLVFSNSFSTCMVFCMAGGSGTKLEGSEPISARSGGVLLLVAISVFMVQSGGTATWQRPWASFRIFHPAEGAC